MYFYLIRKINSLGERIADTCVVYYRIYLNQKDESIVVTLQSFDEGDYQSDRWLSSARWTTEGEAIDAIAPFRVAWLAGLGVRK